MIDPALALQGALRAALVASPALAALVPADHIRAGAIRPERLPSVVFSDAQVEFLGCAAGSQRLARVFLTDAGRERAGAVDAVWKRVEKEALAGLDEKDRKRLKKLLRQIEKNLLPAGVSGNTDDEDDEVVDAGAKPAAPILRDEAEEGASD